MTAAAHVCAVIYAHSADSGVAEVMRAVVAQSRRPEVVLVQATSRRPSTGPTGPGAYVARPGESTLAAGVRAARARHGRWIWLLDGRAVPQPDALEALLTASEVITPPAPVLLAGKVVDGEGHLHPDATPRHEIFEKSHSVDAAERHLVQLRFAAHGSVLVAGSVADRFGAPRSDLAPGTDMREWSARVLRGWEDTGYLVPASVAVRTAAATVLTWRDWLARVRVLGSGAWGPSEKLWEAFLLGGDLLEARQSTRALRSRTGRRRSTRLQPVPQATSDDRHDPGGEAVEA